ncbi:VOC family protein [Sandarakinorhabdus sp. AAP62]|uniref:VOC family protein n=1 Tax=Sandarakinorhabdus sp. AAP62 TaxID=1248916 RepID=UPI0002E193CF|nr:VOC family protein [Sandarakinorhabdus sp. AAP62]
MSLSLDHLVILGRDAAASRAFYADLLPLLGFERRRDDVWVNGDGLHVQVLAAEAGTRAYERRGPGLNHLGFRAPTADFVAQLREAMLAKGHAIQPIQHLGGAHALFMPDPDGLRVEVTWYPPGKNVVD